MLRTLTLLTALGCLSALAFAEAPKSLKLTGTTWTCEIEAETVSGILLKPEGKGPFPALVISHGKGGSVRGFTQQKASQFVKEGFVCIGCNYTHAGEPGQRPGPGPAGRPGRGRFSPDDGASAKNIARAAACLDILESLPDVDAKRIYAYGHSMGGFVTIGLAAEHPDRLKAAIISGSGLAPRDGYPAPSREKAKSIKTPFLMIHGDSDTTVRPEQSLALKEALDATSVANERHVLAGAGHNIDRDRPEESFALAKAWLKRHGAYGANIANGQAAPPDSPREARRDRTQRPGPPEPRVPPGARVDRDIPYVDGGHERQKLDLYRPEKQDGPLPLIIWIHGGGWQAGSRSQSAAIPWVSKGYAVASIGYRLSGDATFPAQIEDCKAAIRFLRAHAKDYQLDPGRFAAWGSSAGGHLVALVGTSADVTSFDVGPHRDQSSRVQAVVDFYGPTDLIQFAKTPGYERHASDTSPESKLLGSPVLESAEKARVANPITYIDAKDPPFLIVHGDADPTVPLNQSESLLMALKAAGVPAELKILSGAKHGGPEFRSTEVTDAVTAFLERTLKPADGPAR